MDVHSCGLDGRLPVLRASIDETKPGLIRVRYEPGFPKLEHGLENLSNA